MAASKPVLGHCLGGQLMARALGARVTPLSAEAGPAFNASGSIYEMLEKVLPAGSFFVAQEFGTYAPVKVLRAMREENRWHHYGAGSPDGPIKMQMKDAFYPPHDDWRAAVIHRGRELFTQSLHLLQRNN